MNASSPPRRRGRRRLATAVLGTGAAVAIALTLPTGSAESRPVRPDGTQRPSPHVLNFAQKLQAPTRPLPNLATRVPVQVDADGCDHAYGEVNQCIPRTFPAGVTSAPGARCTWLLAHGYRSLAVRARDDLGLDTNHDAVACGTGDAGVPGQP